ncbi:uncharacterized protein VTP21DRAFT_1799 [Calcarisporiella thermophila]|uniref:uncharacterized protein n=1 Tax=Calcarisporiella thermophila TaxID=911321 RepID=UPI0037433C88
MPFYAPLLSFYIALQFISLILSVALLISLLKRSTSLTLIGLSTSALILSIVELLTALPYGSDIKSIGGKPLCVLQAYLEDYVHNITSFWALCLAFNLWVVISRRIKRSEREMWPYYAAFSWGFPLILQGISLGVSFKKPGFGTLPGPAFCITSDTIRVPTVMIPSMISTGIGLVLAIYCTVIVIRRRRFFTKSSSRSNGDSYSTPHKTRIKRSLCIRMLTFCMIIGILGLLANIETVSTWSSDPERETQVTSRDPGLDEFSGTLVGIFIFCVFGTTSEMVQLFCPCLSGMSNPFRRSQQSNIPDDPSGSTTHLPNYSSKPGEWSNAYQLGEVKSIMKNGPDLASRTVSPSLTRVGESPFGHGAHAIGERGEELWAEEHGSAHHPSYSNRYP